MNKGIENYMSQRNAEAEAARIIGEALQNARDLLKKAGIDSDESAETIQSILDADE